ncbi:unnamed protein product [Pleuronectes platessa]|uniref:Uncharacterized protein n=1 Tax=Pleuronectes platessa TaxID=8262 RepID=A0A9N7VJQ6_PLEPL|nr:unnamed protein product [Pleuronectes platessa]
MLIPCSRGTDGTEGRYGVASTDGEKDGWREGHEGREGRMERSVRTWMRTGTDGEKDGGREGRMERRTEGEKDGWREGRRERRTEGEKDGWREGRMDGEKDGWIPSTITPISAISSALRAMPLPNKSRAVF